MTSLAAEKFTTSTRAVAARELASFPTRCAISEQRARTLALELLDREALSGLITDYLLDDTRYSGLVLIDLATAKQPGLPAAVVTGVPRDELARATAAIGAVFIPKPVNEDALVPLLLRVLAYDLDLNERVASVAAAKVRAWGLTKREAEILYWHLAGLEGARFVAEKAIAERTYKAHVGAILAKARAGERLLEVTNAILREAVRT